MFILSVALKNTLLNQITAAAGSGALVNIYAGNVPATADTAFDNTVVLLGTMVCAPLFAPPAADGVLTPILPAQGSAITGGTATFYRLVVSGGSTVLAQGLAGTTQTEMILNTVDIIQNGPILCQSFTISM